MPDSPLRNQSATISSLLSQSPPPRMPPEPHHQDSLSTNQV
jgi:hypothetical protein